MTNILFIEYLIFISIFFKYDLKTDSYEFLYQKEK